MIGIASQLTLVALLSVGANAANAQDTIALPSGQPVSLMEIIVDQDLALTRFRFVAPELADRGFEAVADDFAVICSDIALPILDIAQLESDQVVVSLASAPVPFGETDPAIVQFFETYRIENETCIWEYF